MSGIELLQPSMWNWAPSIWAGVTLLTACYLIAVGPLRFRYFHIQKVEQTRVVWFLLGMLVILLALVSPLDALSDHYLFSAHMAQHVLLTLVAPPLLLLGIPAWFYDPVLHSTRIRRVVTALTKPLPAFLLFNVDFLLWHVPGAYEAALLNENIHLIEHLSFIATALVFWWPILNPLESLPRLTYAAQIVYLFLAGVPSTILGAVIIFAPGILYPTYALAPRIFNITSMTDQIIAGVIMAMPATMIYLGALSAVFFSWLSKEERLGKTA